MTMRNIERFALITLDLFLAVTAVGGGIALLFGLMAPGVELLQGSPFSSYTIPGLALLAVGVCAGVAAALVLMRQWLGAPVSAAVGLMIIIFEVVEVLTIGSDPGVARNLQILYFVWGLAMVAVGSSLWLSQRIASAPGGRLSSVHR